MSYSSYVDIQFHNGYPLTDREDRKRPRVEKILQASCDPTEQLTEETCKVLAELISLSGEKNKDAAICLKRNPSQVTTYIIDIRNKSEATRLWNSSHQKKWDRNHLSKILEAYYKQKEPGKDCWRFYYHEQFDRFIEAQCALETKGDTYNLTFKGPNSLMPSRQFKSTFKTRELVLPDDANVVPSLREIFVEAFTHSYQKQKIFDGPAPQLAMYLREIFKKTEEDFMKVDPNEKSHLVVCFLDDAPIGFVELHYPKLPFPGAYIAQLAVHPMWKAHGFGRILLEKARKCIQNECFFWGKVRKSNQRALNFYNHVLSIVPGLQFNYYDDDGNMPLADYPAQEYGTFKCWMPK
jgi:ribosomal protein S18 acetylase RimI-like enzyme